MVPYEECQPNQQITVLDAHHLILQSFHASQQLSLEARGRIEIELFCWKFLLLSGKLFMVAYWLHNQ